MWVKRASAIGTCLHQWTRLTAILIKCSSGCWSMLQSWEGAVLLQSCMSVPCSARQMHGWNSECWDPPMYSNKALQLQVLLVFQGQEPTLWLGEGLKPALTTKGLAGRKNKMKMCRWGLGWPSAFSPYSQEPCFSLQIRSALNIHWVSNWRQVWLFKRKRQNTC